MSGSYFAQAEPCQGIFVGRILVQITGIDYYATFDKIQNISKSDGSG